MFPVASLRSVSFSLLPSNKETPFPTDKYLIRTMLKQLSLQTQGTTQLSGDEKRSFILRLAQKQVNFST